MGFNKFVAIGLLVCFFLSSFAFNSAVSAQEIDFSNHYERIYQIRVVSPNAGSKSSIGSGFQVSADGLIVTNYHVVSGYVNSPENYQIKYVTHDGKKGLLELLDFDVVSDLAILRHPDPADEFFALNSQVIEKGVRAYALGNPGDWGIIMVPGPTNGFVEHSYEERVLFSGSLNPGMSGGPSLNAAGDVVGVNVATAGSQLSFLVPAEKAESLIARNRQLLVADYQLEIAQQIKAWQRPRITTLLTADWNAENFANRSLFGEIRSDFQCWGDTNESNKDRAIALVSKSCGAGDDIYLSRSLNAGQISFSFREAKPLKYNSLQFAKLQDTYMAADNRSRFEHSTNYVCESDFIKPQKTKNKQTGFHRVITCIRAYKKLTGLYDSLLLVQHHRSTVSFDAHLSLSALEKDQIVEFNKQFVEKVL